MGLLFWLLLAVQQGGAPAPESRSAFHSLALERDRYFPAPLRVKAEDLVLDLSEGGAFAAQALGGPTALVMVGKGSLAFTPAVRSEQRQLELFAGSAVLVADFDSAFLRLHPHDFELVFEGPPPSGSPGAALLRRAEATFREQIGLSYAVEGGSPSAPQLSVLPPAGDFVADIHTRRHGEVRYARIGGDPEDIVLADERGRRIATYPSRRHREVFGFSYGDEHGLPYEASHYDVEVAADPSRAELRGRTVAAIRSLERMETVSLRLDGNLQVESVRSSISGSHQFQQQKGRDTLLVRFQPPLDPGSRAALEIRYGGVLEPQDLAAAPGEPQDAAPAERRDSSRHGTLLYSNRVYWFPQSPVRNHATANLTVAVPAGYTALASGVPEAIARDNADGSRRLLFRTETPIRYLSLLIGRLDPVEMSVSGAPMPVDAVSVPARARRARALFAEAGPILRFFSSLIGEVPYPRLTLAFLDTMRPAAHSPAYLAVFGEPSGWIPVSAGDSPTHFPRQPVFHVAHEIAHQWWGQAVGWRNYRDQWLSEALAQYFAALYVRDSRGEDVFRDVLAWMNRWALKGSGKGPVSLGFRVGQLTSCDYCFPAVVYNRGAFVLHMLRKLLGDDAFFRGLRLYYGRWRFLRAGTDDLRAALEESSGWNLQRFFEQWIRDDETPELLWSVRRLAGPGQPQLSLRVEQRPGAFELPVAVTIEYEDRPPSRRFLHVQRSREEFSFELEGRLRRIRLNETFDALCRLREVKP